MDIFFAFVILLNAMLWIVLGYYLWTIAAKAEKLIEETIRKQDDRLRKRHGTTQGPEPKGETSETSETNSRTPGPQGRPPAGRPFRR